MANCEPVTDDVGRRDSGGPVPIQLEDLVKLRCTGKA